MKKRPEINVRLIIFLIIILLGVILRITYFNEEGGDHLTYKTAVTQFLSGENPYEYTVQSFKDPKLKNGYAYFPALLYVQSAFVKLNQAFNLDWPTKYMWKVPILLADLLIVAIFVKKYYKKDYYFALTATTFWMFNPHIIARKEYVLYDPLAIAFLLLSMVNLGKRDFLNGIFFALSISFKSFGAVLFPLILLKSGKKLHFLLGGMLVALLISLPFLYDLNTYLGGTVLVHAERGVQGRPFLTFLSYFGYKYGINFFQSTHSEVYRKLAIILSWLSGVALFYKKKNLTIFQLSLLPIAILTPVLNRTHLLWFLPTIIIGLYDTLKNNRKYFHYALCGLYIFLFAYLYTWNSGYLVRDCSMVSIEPSEKALSETCSPRDEFSFSHCPKELGKCLPHCCVK